MSLRICEGANRPMICVLCPVRSPRSVARSKEYGLVYSFATDNGPRTTDYQVENMPHGRYNSNRHFIEEAMRNFIAAAVIIALGTCVARAQDDDQVKLLALQKAVQKTIRENEASIACIIVSRSELYRKKPGASPGKLGDFDPAEVEFEPGMSARERTQLLKKLDLADTNNFPAAFGSGIVIDAGGLVLTNYHVVQDATKL